VLAVRAGTAPQAAAGIDAGDGTLASAAARQEPGAAEAAQVPRTVEDAVATLPDANVAIVSVPGPFAALEAHKALSQGLHVLLFSDNVGLGDEVALKQRGASLGRLVMGPGAGTAMLGGAAPAGSARQAGGRRPRRPGAAGRGPPGRGGRRHAGGGGPPNAGGAGRDAARSVGRPHLARLLGAGGTGAGTAQRARPVLRW